MAGEAPPLLRVQGRILLSGGMALAVIVLAARHVMAQPLQLDATASAALAEAARWLVLPGATLLAGIVLVANFRFLHREEIDGRTDSASRLFEIGLRYNRNTLEQLVLAVAAWLGLAVEEPGRAASAFPVLAALFVIGRLAFGFGYAITPWARAFGFVLTALPTAGLLFWQIARLV
jgi:hypothetical protein